MMKSVKYYLLFLLPLLTRAAEAQMIFDTLYLDETEIISFQYERNTPASTQEIDTLVKSELNHLSLAELLSVHTPVFVKAYGKGSLATASFRGTAASHTKVLWNGFEINSPMLGQVDLSLVPNNLYSRAVLNYGGSSLENTTGALGGSINLLNTGRMSDATVSVEQTMASFKTFSTALNANFGNEKFRSLSTVHLVSSDNSFRFYNNAVIPPERHVQKEASYDNMGFTQAFIYHPAKYHEIRVMTWNQWNYRQIPPIMSNQGEGNHGEEQNSFTSRNIAQWNYHKGKTQIRVKTAWFYENFDYLLVTTTSVNPEDTVTFIQSLNKTNSAFVKANVEQQLGKEWLLTGGLDLAWHRINSNNYDGMKLRDEYGLFVKAEKSFSEYLNMEFIIRQQYVDGCFTPPAPFAGISLKPFKTQELYFRLNGNYNYNLPGLNDLYWYPGGNEQLQPEKGLQYEGGISYRKYFSRSLALSVDVSAYDSYIHNWIQWVPTDHRYWTARNIAFVHARGVEVNFQLNGYTGKVQYKFIARYSYTRSTNESDEAVEGGYDGRQLIYVPLHTGNIFAFTAYRNFELTWDTELTGKRNTSLNEEDLYSNVLPFYSLSHVSLGKSFDVKNIRLAIKLKVNNLFNVSYQAVLWRAMPGINYEIFLAFKWK